MEKTERGAYGKKMIRFTVKFWTSGLPEGADKKTAWQSGVITLLKNVNKGIKPDMIFFRGLHEFNKKFQELLDRNNITLIDRPPKDKFIKKKFE